MEFTYIVLFLAAFWAGAQNALAGGGSFVTLPALIFAGLDARAANITSTVALFPGQIVSGWTNRTLATGTPSLGLLPMVLVSAAGGAVGAVLLLVTPASFFALLVPWLVLFATGIFAWGTFGRKAAANARPMGAVAAGVLQFLVSVYGGYFGGGIGFLMLAVLTIAGAVVREASATKNVLAGVINAGAILIFLFSPEIGWTQAAITCAGAVGGGLVGAWAMPRVPERTLRIGIIVIGVLLTIGLFLRA